jgi:NADH-quinone oxidoreductase subunit C
MTADEILAQLQAAFPNSPFQLQSGEAGDRWILIQSADVVPVLSHLRDRLGLTYLATLAGIDYGANLGVAYVVRSLEKKDEVIVKALIDKENPAIDTVSHIYGDAEWFEREAFDLLGITFAKHPDLRRIMMPDDWEGHPLRKDYKYPTEYHGIPCARPDSHAVLDPLYPKPPAADKAPAAKADKPGPVNTPPPAESKEIPS